MGLISVKSQIKRSFREADEDSCDVLMAESGKINTQMLGYFIRGAHTTCAQKESGSVLTSL